jgi:hypothetical protein
VDWWSGTFAGWHHGLVAISRGEEPLMKKSVLVGWVVLGLLAMASPVSLAQGNGVIQGQIVNGTAGGGSTAGLEVELRVFQETSEGESLVATTDAQGAFRFENLQTGTDWAYLVRVIYQNVVYSTGLLAFEPDQSELATEVSVYETTTDYEGIGVERAHIFVTISGSTLSVSELSVFANRTDRTYIGTGEVEGQRWASRFLLPDDSYALAFEDGTLGGRFLSVPGGFVDLEPLWPGSTSVMYSYAVDCQGGECDLGRELSHPVAALNLLVGDTTVQVQSNGLTFDGEREAEGRRYLNYSGGGLQAGDRLDLVIRLSGSVPVQSAAAKTSSSSLPWIILGGVLVALVLVYPFWRQRIRAAAIEESRKPARDHERTER